MEADIVTGPSAYKKKICCRAGHMKVHFLEYETTIPYLKSKDNIWVCKKNQGAHSNFTTDTWKHESSSWKCMMHLYLSWIQWKSVFCIERMWKNDDVLGFSSCNCHVQRKIFVKHKISCEIQRKKWNFNEKLFF